MDEPAADSELVPTKLRGQAVHTHGIGDADFVTSTGNVRCKAKTRTGSRCARSSVKGDPNSLCHLHGGDAWQEYCRSAGRYGDLLGRNEQALETFEKFLMDPDLCDVGPELALQRTMLTAALAKIKASNKGLHEIGGDTMAAVTAMNHAVALLAEKKATIDRRREKHVSVQQLHYFLEQVTRIITDVIADPDQVNEIADRLDGIVLPQSRVLTKVQRDGA